MNIERLILFEGGTACTKNTRNPENIQATHAKWSTVYSLIIGLAEGRGRGRGIFARDNATCYNNNIQEIVVRHLQTKGIASYINV